MRVYRFLKLYIIIPRRNNQSNNRRKLIYQKTDSSRDAGSIFFHYRLELLKSIYILIQNSTISDCNNNRRNARVFPQITVFIFRGLKYDPRYNRITDGASLRYLIEIFAMIRYYIS